jgi:hypothetical protein
MKTSHRNAQWRLAASAPRKAFTDLRASNPSAANVAALAEQVAHHIARSASGRSDLEATITFSNEERRRA